LHAYEVEGRRRKFRRVQTDDQVQRAARQPHDGGDAGAAQSGLIDEGGIVQPHAQPRQRLRLQLDDIARAAECRGDLARDTAGVVADRDRSRRCGC
jgi:hypothetical protein